MDYKEIIDKLLSDRLEVDFEVIHDHFRTKVYKLNYPTPLVVRISKDNIKKVAFDKALLDQIDDSSLTSKILYFEERVIKDENFLIQIQLFVSGYPLRNYPDISLCKQITRATYNLQNKLKRVSKNFEELMIPNIDQILSMITNDINDQRLIIEAKRLMENSRFKELSKANESYLTHFDLWPENILIDGDSVRFIDLDPIIYGHKLFQPAVLFSSYFLLGSYLFNEVEKFDIDQLIEIWPVDLVKYDLLLLMLVFPLGIAINKERQFKSDEQFNKDDYNESIKPLLYSIDYIWNEISKTSQANEKFTY